MAEETSSHVVIGAPLTAMMRSFSWNPAALAGEAGSPAAQSGCGACTVGVAVGTHSEISPTFGATWGSP